ARRLRATVPVPRAGRHPGGDGHPDDGAVGDSGTPDDAAVGRRGDGAHAAAPAPLELRSGDADRSPAGARLPPMTAPQEENTMSTAGPTGTAPETTGAPDSGMATGSDAGEPGSHLGPGDLDPD